MAFCVALFPSRSLGSRLNPLLRAYPPFPRLPFCQIGSVIVTLLTKFNRHYLLNNLISFNILRWKGLIQRKILLLLLTVVWIPSFVGLLLYLVLYGMLLCAKHCAECEGAKMKLNTMPALKELTDTWWSNGDMHQG